MSRAAASILLANVYVDDIITEAREPDVEAFKVQMKSTFNTTDLGLLSFYLGVEVHQDAVAITLRQSHYAKRILELSGMADYNPASTPMEERLRLSKHSTVEVNSTHYRRLIGSLRYLVHTHPDQAFTVDFVSRFLERPIVEHQQADKRILRYVAGTLDFSLHFTKAPTAARFMGYYDSDLANDIDSSKSTTRSW